MKRFILIAFIILIAGCAQNKSNIKSATGLGTSPFATGGTFTAAKANAMNDAINDNALRVSGNVTTEAELIAATKYAKLSSNITLTSNRTISVPLDTNGYTISGAYTLTISTTDFRGTYGCFGSSVTVSGLKYVEPEWWGVAGDGTDESTEAQAALDALASGGVYQLRANNYKFKLTVSVDNITIRGPSPVKNWSDTTGIALITLPSAGSVIDTQAGALYGLNVENILFYGAGAGTAGIAVRFRNVTDGRVENNVFYNFADQGVLIEAGVANKIIRNMGINCLLDTTRDQKEGVFELHGSDFYVIDNEAACGLSALSDSNSRVEGYVVGSDNVGGNHFFEGNIGEYCDEGIVIYNDFSRFLDNRMDNNFGHGWELISASVNQLGHNMSLFNGKETNDTYDGYHVGADCYVNKFTGNISYGIDPGNKPRYGFYDESQASSHGAKNTYFNNTSINHVTSHFYSDSSGNSPSFDGMTNGRFLVTTGTTIDVSQANLYVLAYGSDETITNFTNGSTGQTIRLIRTAGAGVPTIEWNANIRTNTGYSKSMELYRVYTFTNDANVWMENEGLPSGEYLLPNQLSLGIGGATISGNEDSVTATEMLQDQTIDHGSSVEDYSGSQLTLPNYVFLGANADPATNGEFVYDTTVTGHLYGALRYQNSNGDDRDIVDIPSGVAQHEECYPQFAATAADDYPLVKYPWDITIRKVTLYQIGATNMVGMLDECTGAGGVCSSVTAVDSSDITGTDGAIVADDGTLSNPDITAGNYLYWHTTSVSGTNTSYSICWQYDIK